MINFFISKFSKTNDWGYPYTYLSVLTNYQFYNSYQVLMMINKKQFGGMARLHYINSTTFELGDFYIDPNFRSKKYHNKKYYQYLMEEVINIAKDKNKNLKQITLAVNKDNIAAIKIYEKNGFVKFTNKSKKNYQNIII